MPPRRGSSTLPLVTLDNGVSAVGRKDRPVRRADCRRADRSCSVAMVPWSNGPGHVSYKHGMMVRLHRGLLKWSAGVSAARLRGKEEGRVQFPGGPLFVVGGACPKGRRGCLASGLRWVRFPSSPLYLGCWSNGKTPTSRVGNRGSTPRRSTERNGLIVQWEDTGAACRKSGFESRLVHCGRPSSLLAHSCVPHKGELTNSSL